MSNYGFTSKEINMISDILTQEENLFKKAKLYSNTLTDMNLAESMSKIAISHQNKFNELFDILKGGNI